MNGAGDDGGLRGRLPYEQRRVPALRPNAVAARSGSTSAAPAIVVRSTMITQAIRLQPGWITSRVMLVAVLTAGVTGLSGQAQQRERRLAFVVGNDAYRDAPLKNAKNDALAVSAELRDVGFTVTPLYDASRDQFTDALAKFASALRPDDL